MRIANVEDLHADGGWRTISFLKLTTDEGLVGWAEFYDGFGAGGVSDLIRRFGTIVKGMDPRDVGRISTSLHAISRMAAGGMNHQAIAAIENACLDVKAKALSVPVYALFGGAMRERLDLYWSHCGSFRVWQRDFFEQELGLAPVRTLDDLTELGREAVRHGYKALKTNPLQLGEGARPFNPGFRIVPGLLDRSTDARWIGQIGDVLAAFRDGAGPDMGIMLDLNFSQRTDGFLRIAQAVEPFKLTWLEVDLHDPEALALVRRSTRTPIASLESLYGLKQYRPFLQNYAVDVAVVDVPWNGLWESMRVATLADAFEVDVAPHNYYGDLATLMSAHFCAAVPNFRIMEYEVDDVPWRSEFVTHSPVVENGQLLVPTRPGWGADVNEEAVRARPPRRKV
jgi:L-alanine-DL-glutamate epimerase-like enolase superfamily enzyme